MSFFRDFKEDAKQALNELMPGDDDLKDEELEKDNDMLVNTLESELDVASELSKLDGLLEKVAKDVNEPKSAADKIRTISAEPAIKLEVPEPEPVIEPEPVAPAPAVSAPITIEEPVMPKQPVVTTPVTTQPEATKPVVPQTDSNINKTLESLKKVEEDKNMSELNNELNQTTATAPTMTMPVAPILDGEISDETSVITEGTRLTGNMESTGSLDIRGTINGDVTCNGKLLVTGTIVGNSTSSEFFADAAKIEGEVVSSGTVKVGLGSVIIGNISATSAVIAGAIKGDIDVQGPVVVDTSAVVMGNIKSRSVQINNGAVIEGFCSQCYAEVDVASLFGDKKVK